MTTFHISTIVIPSGTGRIDIHDTVLVLDHEKQTAKYKVQRYMDMPDIRNMSPLNKEYTAAFMEAKTLYGDSLPWL